MTCPPDRSASISKDEPISVFCTDVQCENIAFACDGYSNVPNNDGIVEDSFENEVPRASQVNQDNSFRSDVCRSDESNNEGFRFDVFQSDDKEIEVSRSDVCRSDDSNDVGFRFDVFQSDDKEIEFSRSDVCRSDDSNDVGFRFDVFQSDDKEIEFSRSDVCRSDDSNDVGFRFDVFQSDDKEIEFSRSDVCRSDDSNDVGFRFDVFQSDDKEIEFSRSDVYRSDDSNNLGFRFDVSHSNDKEIELSRFDACPNDGSKNVSLRLDIDSDDAEVFSAYRDDQEFLVDSGQNSETSPSCKVTSEPSEPDVLHSDDLERVGIGPKREAHNLCHTDCSDQGPQYTYTAADVTIAETHVDIDGVIPQIASMEETPSPSQDTCNGTPPGLPPDSLYVHGIIQNTPSFMLVDTGASVTAVSSSLFARISPPVQLDPAPLPYIRTVSGEHLPVQGIAKLTFIFADVSYSFESLVIDQLTYPVVLGRDFLLSLGSVIDMQNHTLTFLGQEPISLHSNRLTRSSQTDEHVTVHAHATYILPPLTESVIPVYPKRLLPTGTTGLIEPSSKLLTRYQIGGATQLVSLSEENTFPFRLLNPTSRPITIYRCSTLGSFTPAASEMSVITTEDNSDASATSKCDPSDQNETDVPLDLSDSTLTPPEKAQLLALINEYRDNFATSPEELGRTGLVTHKIDTGDQPPIRQRPYRVSHQQFSPLIVYHFPCDLEFSTQRTGFGSCPDRISTHIPLFTDSTFRYVPWERDNSALLDLHYKSLNISPPLVLNKSTLQSLDKTYHLLDNQLDSQLAAIQHDLANVRSTPHRRTLPDLCLYVSFSLTIANTLALIVFCYRSRKRLPNQSLSWFPFTRTRRLPKAPSDGDRSDQVIEETELATFSPPPENRPSNCASTSCPKHS